MTNFYVSDTIDASNEKGTNVYVILHNLIENGLKVVFVTKKIIYSFANLDAFVEKQTVLFDI